MIRTTFITGFLLLFLVPLDAAALWFGDESQCFADAAGLVEDTETLSLEEAVDFDCDTTSDSDASSNACFEGAEHPISALPELIAQSQAEQLVADVLAGVVEAATDKVGPVIPSPSEASVEDPQLPGLPLVERPVIPKPKRAPNACSVYPEDCEKAPFTPTLNLDASGPQAREVQTHLDIDPAPEIDQQRRGPPNTGLGPATGIQRRVERPPQMT